MFDGSHYRADQTTLEPGEVLTIYSDGVTEAEDQAGTPFDERGLERIIDGHDTVSASQLGAAVVSAVEMHAHATRLADDVTILVLRRCAA